EAAAAPDSALGAIFAKQLELMAKQLELLRAAPAGQPATLPIAPAHAPAAAERPAPSPAARAASVPVALPAFKRHAASPREGSERQQRIIQALVDDYGQKTSGSKAMTQRYRPHFANIRNVAGF